MPISKYPTSWEPMHTTSDWMVDFTEISKKLKEREKYDRVWELIKKKNGW